MALGRKQAKGEVLLKKVIALNLRRIRLKRGLTQEELSEFTGIARSTIAKYENCTVTITLYKVLTFAKALNVSVEELLDGWEICI